MLNDDIGAIYAYIQDGPKVTHHGHSKDVNRVSKDVNLGLANAFAKITSSNFSDVLGRLDLLYQLPFRLSTVLCIIGSSCRLGCLRLNSAATSLGIGAEFVILPGMRKLYDVKIKTLPFDCL